MEPSTPPGPSASGRSETPGLVERLAALTKLGGIPRDQLEWLARHGEVRWFPKGAVFIKPGQAVADLYVVLAGRLSVELDRGGVRRRVREWKRGDISGLLPYSRLKTGPGEVTFDEPTELLVIEGRWIREMTRECYELTELSVHEMLDRARQFRTDDLQVEKMASLGRLAAGLAHELNNPSSAMARSAREFDACRLRLSDASRRLGAAGFSPDQVAVVQQLVSAVGDVRRHRSPVERADREDLLAQWLVVHGVDEALAETLADTDLMLEQLDASARALPGACLDAALQWLAADVTARALTSEIGAAADRIHSLVAAVKSFSRMDRAPVLEPVDLGQGLHDTVTLLRAKARARSVDVSLRVAEPLPPVQGFGGELNQVWVNLLDNAIDAAPAGGHVEIDAVAEDRRLVVSVTDSGPGIPEAIRSRIFDPFFTTKPMGEGTGLGLDIAQGIVHRHGGAIDVESAPGRTVFHVRLPLAARATSEGR